MRRRDIPPADIVALLELPDKHPVMRAAMDAVFACVLVDELQIKMGGARAGKSERRFHDEVYVPQMKLLFRHLLCLGWCPIIVRPAVTDGSDDTELAAGFEVAPEDLTEVKGDVFIIPEPLTYRVQMDIDDAGRLLLTGFSTNDEHAEFYVIRSIVHKGPSMYSAITSTPVGVLRGPFEQLCRLERLAEQILYANAIPSLFVEKVPPTQHQAEANMAIKETADKILDMNGAAPAEAKDTYAVDTAEGRVSSRKRPYADMIAAIAEGKSVDPQEAMIYLPDQYHLGTQHANARALPDIAAERAAFAQNVGAVFHVPDAYMTGATGSGLNDGQNAKASEHDTTRMRRAIDAAHRDLTHAISSIIRLLVKDPKREPTVILPVASLARPEHLIEAYHAACIDHPAFCRHYAHSVGIPAEYVNQGSGRAVLPDRLDKADKKPREVGA